MIDIVLLALLGIAGYKGFKDGIIMEVFSFLAVVVALIVSVRLLHPAVEAMAPHVRNAGPALPFITFALVFAVVFLLVFLAGKFLKSAMKLTVMGTVDQVAGAVLGILKVGFLFGLLFWIGDLINIAKVFPILEESFMVKITRDFSSTMVHILNHAFPVKEIFEKIKHIIHGTKSGSF